MRSRITISTLAEEDWLCGVGHDTPDAAEARRVFSEAARNGMEWWGDIQWNTPGNTIVATDDDATAALGRGLTAVSEYADKLASRDED